MDTATLLFSSTLFGSIGVGYFIYGKKQQQFVPTLTGLLLCVYPYFVSNIYLMFTIGAFLTLLPWIFRW